MKLNTKIKLLLALATLVSSWLLLSANGAAMFGSGEGGP